MAVHKIEKKLNKKRPFNVSELKVTDMKFEADSVNISDIQLIKLIDSETITVDLKVSFMGELRVKVASQLKIQYLFVWLLDKETDPIQCGTCSDSS